MNTDKLKKIIEGFLFASDKALSVEQLVKLFPEGEQPEKDDISYCIDALMEDFENHGIELKQVRSGYRFQVRQETAPWVARLWDEKPAKYTRAMLETLALIVYRQPITRGEIEEIRGVSVSSHIIKTLMERDWVKVIGHRDVPGRPALYASTKEFLDYFNLTSLEELPPLSEIKDLDAIATELDPEQNASLISAIREMQKEDAESEASSLAQNETESIDESDEQQLVSETASTEQVEMAEEMTDESSAAEGQVADEIVSAEETEDEITAEEAYEDDAIVAHASMASDEDGSDEVAEEAVLESESKDTNEETADTVENENKSKSFSDLVSNFGKHQSEDEEADKKSEQESDEAWKRQDSSMETDPQ